jgi:hypothetical protein
LRKQPSTISESGSVWRPIAPEAARIRAEALVESEQTKGSPPKKPKQNRHRPRSRLRPSRTDQQGLHGANSSCRRETEVLHQRKQAVLSQLASLSALAEQTASAFPDLDDPSELEGEVGDRTVMRPDMLPPAGPNEDSSAGSKAGPARNGGGSGEAGRSGEDEELEIDGDATVLVAPSDLSGEGAKSK